MDKRIERRVIRSAYRRHAVVTAANDLIDNGTKVVHVDPDANIEYARNGAWVTCRVHVTGAEIRRYEEDSDV